MSEKIKNILLTGHCGYIGSVLHHRLLSLGYTVIGWDVEEGNDIREIKRPDLAGIDVIIHLAALASNPLGEVSPSETYNVNYRASVDLGKLAKKVGVKKLIFASGLSIYNNSETTYSKSKFLAESDLMRLIDDKFKVVVIRAGVVFGPSPNMRYDTVLNQFVFTNEIMVKGDGSTVVQVTHIDDLCNAYVAALDSESGTFNIKSGEYTVKEIAEVVKRVASPKLGNTLYQPKWSLEDGIKNLVEYLGK
jgi:nucleoside-diphosphate-sugar epimerase